MLILLKRNLEEQCVVLFERRSQLDVIFPSVHQNKLNDIEFVKCAGKVCQTGQLKSFHLEWESTLVFRVTFVGLCNAVTAEVGGAQVKIGAFCCLTSEDMFT